MPNRDAPPNLPPMDPSLWLVHYSATEVANQIPAGSVQLNYEIHQLIAERNSLQGHGQLQLQHKEFMLRDRDNWPTINLPGNPNPSYPQQSMVYPNNVMAHMNRNQHPASMQQSQVAMSPGGTVPSPAKRPRHASSSHRHSSATAIPMPMPIIFPDLDFDDEETISGADYMDLLTPQQVSRSRYVQHHEWLEEVLNSPYDSHQIVPSVLGLGRKGELESLTRDFFDAPEHGTGRKVLELPRTPHEEDVEANKSMVPDDGPSRRVGRMEAGKADDFTKRAAQRMADLHEEMEKLKRQHARRMAKLNGGHSWREAEQRLRVATLSLMNGDSLKSGDEQDEQDYRIVKTMEENLGKQIKPILEVECINKGGLEEKRQASASTDADIDMNDSLVNSNEAQGALETNTQAAALSSTPTPVTSTPKAADVPPTTPHEERQPPADVLPSSSPAPSDIKDTAADDWVMVNRDADAAVQDQDQAPDQEQSAFDSFTNDATMEMDENNVKVVDNLESSTPADGGLTFGDPDFGGGIEFGDLDTAGDELSGYAQDIQDMGAEDQQTSGVEHPSTGNSFQTSNSPPKQEDHTTL